MKTITQLLVSLVIAFWVIFVALLSVQNAQLVYLKLFTFQSINMPVGLLLTFSFATGLILMSILPSIWNAIGSGNNNSRYQNDSDFFVEKEEY
ncbi:MAG: lipopolysaccharide assembly protein LapA domain-containing protein [Cyanobacteria bacterium P01_A01_bin.68]